MKKLLYIVLLGLWLASCNLPVPETNIPEPALSWSPEPSPVPAVPFAPSPEPSPTPSDQPGLVVIGRVTLNGMGLAGVEIYRRFNAYPSVLIAITDENGYYESDFIGIPGDEMTSIEAGLAGYTFSPPYHYWRHYHGYEITTCDFAAVPAP